MYLVALYYSVFWLLVVFDKGFSEKKTKLKRLPLVSVIVPAYNEEKTIGNTIKSLLSLDYPHDKLEIIAVNDGSKDNTLKVIEDIIKNNKNRNIILINQLNQGKARSLNNGLKIAKGEFFACLDADSVVEKDALKKMLAVFQSNGSELAIVTPSMRIRNPETMLQKFQRLEYIMSITWARFRSKLDCAHVAPGPFSLYRKEYVTKLGGFDENNLTEDQEIAYRMQKNHYRILQCPEAKVYTICPHDLKGLYRQRNRWFKGSLLNVLKYRSMMFNREYANFGMLQMPINLFTFFTGIAALFFLFKLSVWPLLKKLRDLYLIRFDVLPLLGNMEFSFNALFNVEFAKFFMVITLLLLVFVWFYISHKSTDEKISRYGVVYFIPYFLAYFLILSFISVIVFAEILRGKIQKW